MPTLPIDKDNLRCGLLRVPLERVRRELDDYSRLVRRFAINRPDFYVEKFTARDYQVPLFFHQPFWDEENFNYDVGISVQRVVIGKSSEWKNWIEEEMRLLEYGYRTIWAVWILDGLWSFSLVFGSSLLSDEEKESFKVEPDYFDVDAFFTEKNWVKPSQEQAADMASQSKKVYLKLQEIANLVPRDIYGQKYLQAPTSVSTPKCSFAVASSVFIRAVDEFTSLLGAPRYLEYFVDSVESAERSSSFSNNPDRRVWSQFVLSIESTRKGFDIYQKPADSSIVRAYPILTAQTTRWPEFHFQMNVVHAHGESFIECFAIDPIWFDWTCNFFKAPIEMWEGPIEPRFGWYGDASRGKVVPYVADPTRQLGSSAALKRAFLVFPIGIDYEDDEIEINELRYEDPQAIFRSQEEAESYASENISSLLGDVDISELTANKIDFDLMQLETYPQICQLLEISPSDDWRKEFKDLFYRALPVDIMNRLIALLGIKTYRIIACDLEDVEYERIAKAIKDRKFTKRTSDWLAKRVGLEMYSGSF